MILKIVDAKSNVFDCNIVTATSYNNENSNITICVGGSDIIINIDEITAMSYKQDKVYEWHDIKVPNEYDVDEAAEAIQEIIWSRKIPTILATSI